MTRFSIPTLIIALLVVLILLTFACTYQVGFNEAAIKVRLGKADESSIITTPGLKLRWPWPFEEITHYDTRLRTMDTPETEIKTHDGKSVIVGSYAVWRIEKPLQFYNRARTVKIAEGHMRARISQVQATIVGQRTLPDFVNLDRELLDASYDRILRDMLDKKEIVDGREVEVGVRAGLLRDFGIGLEKIGIRRISLPQEVTKKVFDSMIQERRTLAARYREEGKSRAEAIKARAESDADQILSFADAKAKEIRSAGYQASARILAQIDEADRELFEWLRWLDALKATLKQRTTIFIDKDWPLFEPFVNPPIPAGEQP
ncbi:MAG: protease modulator HflC [Phycisphaerae bacterium]|nr:protease modulator HflC [Phycisphaerae bacterium]